MHLPFKAKVFDIEQGQHEIVLNENEANRLEIEIQDRVVVTKGKKSLVAIADHSFHLVSDKEIGVFWEVAQELGIKNGDRVFLGHAERPSSLDSIRKKLDGQPLNRAEIGEIIADLMEQKLSNAELSAFIAAVYARGMQVEETKALTEAIYKSGEVLSFKKGPVCSEHSIGGVAGDRTSMVFVPIMASLDIVIPKTCSRAISSASGSADVMELFAPVSLTAQQMKKVVDKTNGAIVWGGAVNMAAADDKLIRIRHPLRLDPRPLLLSSILAKKKAEGANYVLLDIPTGAGAKMASMEEAHSLAKEFNALGSYMDMHVECTITDGSEPLMHCIGPSLEAKAVLETLMGKGEKGLAEKATHMAGVALAALRGITYEEGCSIASHRLQDGLALKKFREIIAAQGGNPNVKPSDLKLGKYRKVVFSKEEGKIEHVDNKALSRIVRALGAPEDAQGGMVLKAMKGDYVKKGDPLFELYASSKEKLGIGLLKLEKYYPVSIGKVILDVVREEGFHYMKKKRKC
ncbi:AMP phosphorylase [Candidatus Micrarchaeota archaeon]|nr:AMP phosphorylase [Candidatus Micrarchaeota archaeon]